MMFSMFEKAVREGNLETASYVFSEEDLLARIQLLREDLPKKTRLIYAVKANPFLVPLLKGHVDGFEICSPGEEHICREHGVDPRDYVISGVHKDDADMARVLSVSGGDKAEDIRFTIESPHQAVLLEKKAAEQDRILPVLIRLTAGNQFGVDEKTVLELIKNRRKDLPHLDIRSLQFYSGTQKKDKKIVGELQRLDDFIDMIRKETDFEFSELEYGPGLYVSYFENETDAAKEAVINLSKALDSLRFRGIISLEMGRFIAATCGYYVTRISDIKTSGGATYLILDGGIHQLNYYGQMMAMKTPHILSKGGIRDVKACLCGSLCTVGDVLARDVALADPQIGDILVFTTCGAYSVTEGIANFLSRDLPAVAVYRQGQLTTLRTRRDIWETNYGNFT